MFDNIFVGSSAVFPNRPGPVEHKTKGGYDTDKMEKKDSAEKTAIKPKGKRKEKRIHSAIVVEVA